MQRPKVLSSRPIVRGAVAAALLAGIATLTVSIGAASADQTISSSGPLTAIGVTSDLNCSTNYAGDESGEWYGDTACGTLLATGGTLYGPADIPAGGAASPLTAWTPVSQTAVTGSGTTGDPYKVVTVDTGGTIQVTETDTYVVGSESYDDSVQVTNTGSSTSTGVLYRGGDCYLQDSDTGYGIYDSSSGAISCTTSLTPGSRIEQMDPVTAGSDYFEGFYNTLWTDIGTQDPFPNTCDCSIDEDNSLGLSWNFSLAADASQTYSSVVTFSPAGAQPLTLAKTADSSTVAAGGTDGYTITASNPNATAVTLATLTDTLGAGFTYQPGTSTGVTTTDPTVSGQTLTWDNIVVPAGGSASLHFDVTAPSTGGRYDDDAEGTASGYTVVGTGATAPVTVTASSSPSPTTLSTLLSGGDESGTSISVPAGTAVTDSATLSGTNAASATGTVTYDVYTNATCTTLATGGGGTARTITTAGTLPASAAVTLSTPGTYYWQASYSGDANNATSTSTCGAETETVTSPNTTTTTCQTGQTCTGTVTIAGSMSVSVSGTSSTTGSLTVSLGTNAISCGDPFRHAPSMTTVTESGLTINGTKTAVVTINRSVVFARGAPWWIPYAVCYSSTHPFKSITGRVTTLGLLPYCSSRSTRPPFGPPPCVVSIQPDRSGNLIETLQLPGYDPRFH